MYYLRKFQSGKSETITLAGPALTLGSAPDNDIVLDDPEIPPVAMSMTQVEEGFSITVAALRWKPVFNGMRCDSFLMRPGDRLEVGSLALILDRRDESALVPPETHGPGSGFREGLARLCAMVAEERDLKILLEKLVHLLPEAMGGNVAILFHLDASGRPRITASSREGDASRFFSDTVVGEVLRSRRGLFLSNALADPAYSRSQSVSDLNLHSVLCCPILTAGKVSGIVYLGSNLPSVSFGERELRELEVYSLVAGCLINHVEYIARQGQVLASLRADSRQEGIVAVSPPMKMVLDEIQAVSASNIAVLLQGETGTGKDVFAQLIHKRSGRRGKPFLAVNCSTLRGELLASELFGHQKGAFTGAIRDQKGMFQAADGGTLFLDEIGEMDPPLQAMLLRTLENGLVRPVGQAKEIPTDVRILCATNRNLEEMVAKGAFRQDLFYRINPHSIHLPPLRERGEDILILAYHFLEKTKALYPDKHLEGFHPDSLTALGGYAWPGNVRELANVVHKAALFARTPLVQVVFPEGKGSWVPLEQAARQFQWDYLQRALAACGGDREKAAALLGVGRSTLFRYLAQGREGNAGPSATDQ